MSEQGDRSFNARPLLEAAKKCGCYFCLKVYNPKDIKKWIDNELTAVCPKCGIDSVVAYEEQLDETDETFLLKLKTWRKESFW